MQATRLAEICGLVGEDGRFLLQAALEAADFPQGAAQAQDAFQDFRHKVNSAAKAAGVDLQLELDSRKTSPDKRYGWFTGGDLVDEGIAAFTGEAAGRTGISQPVSPEVAELGGSRRTRVYVSFHPTTGTTARRVDALLDQLRQMLGALDSECSWEVQDSRSVGLGEDAEQVRDRLSAEADVRVALVSPAYLAYSEERRRALERPDRVVAFAFSGLPDGPIDVSPLRLHQVRRLDKPWDELTRPAQRKDYVKDLVQQIQGVLAPAPPVPGERTGDTLEHWATKVAHRQRGDDSRYLIPANIAETSLQESQLDSARRAAGRPLQAVDRLISWATGNSSAPRLCALLGDVGMGKTTTAKLFTQQLLKLREKNTNVPLPILFDLRDVRITSLVESMTLDHILDSMLDATRPTGVPRERLNADVVRKRLDKGDVVVVFDGLDEVLVHLSPHDRQLFTRQLWRAINESSAARMLLTCRTQYFRTIRDEITYFTGETRQDIHGSDYLALLMLPFRDEQVREYLAANLNRDTASVDRFLETIAAVHDLPDLARRPITLRLIADQVEFIETAKLEGRTLRSVDIYSEVVERWISRDAGKHTLTPDHKRLLMEEVAAALWRSGQNAWSPTEVDDWLLDLLAHRPELQRHYRERVPDLWKADFRTATFLKREGDKFEFGHRSLFEYFLARYLYRMLSSPGLPDLGFDAIAMPVPSPETLDFLGQSIAAAGPQSTTLATLQHIGRQYVPQASELALSYALHASQHGHPHHSLNGIQLSGANLTDWYIGHEDRNSTLQMAGANFTGADLRRAEFLNIDLTGADFAGADVSQAEFHGSQLKNSLWNGARAIGTILRSCNIDSVDFSNAEKYRAQLLNCTPPPASGTSLLVAPVAHTDETERANEGQLLPLTGHTGSVNAVAWSPDSTRIVTGGYGGVRVWDAATGELFHDVAGSVNAVAWSPDSTRIVTGGYGGVRVWDAATGELFHDVAGSVKRVAWSPDSSRIVTGSDDSGVRVWDAATGVFIHRLAGHTGSVRGVAWSSDGTRIITGSGNSDDDDDGVRVWDAATGELLHELAGLAGLVNAVAWSPDSSRIVTGRDDGGVRVWDAATGEVLHRLAGLTGSVNAVAWSPDNTRVLAGSDTGARVWDAATGEVLHRLAGRVDWVRAVAWSPDSRRIVTGSDDSGVRVWDAATGELLHCLGLVDWVRAVAWSPDNTRVLAGSDSGARVWDAATGELLHELAGLAGSVKGVAWSPDSRRIVTGSDDSGVRVWDAATGELLHDLAGLAGSVKGVAWSPDNTRVLAGSDSGARVWDAATGELLHDLAGLAGSVNAVAWSSDSRRIVTGSDDSGVRVWDAATGELLHDLAGLAGSVNAVAWSPDNTRILTGSADNSVRIWDAATGEFLQRFAGHVDWVRAVAWSPDNTRILTGSDDNTIRIWDLATDQPSGLMFVLFPNAEHAIFSIEQDELVACTEGCWRWLGVVTIKDGRLDRLPAETFNPLPVRDQFADLSRS
jgi:WD40 repeat protein